MIRSRMLPALILLGSTVVLSTIMHRLIGRFIVASLVSASIAAVSLQVLTALELGHMDQFWLIALPLSFFLALIVALATGYIFMNFSNRNVK
jgi:hypothetical protein